MIERSFGLLKIRMAVFQKKLQCNMDSNNRLIVACALLHNFLIDYEGTDYVKDVESEVGPEDSASGPLNPQSSRDEVSQLRDKNAEKVWQTRHVY